MENKYLDNNGNELIAASVNGFLRLYIGSTRTPYTGSVNMQSECENNIDPCGSNSGCASKNGLPHYSLRPNVYLNHLNENGEYDHGVLREQLNFDDTLPEGTCSGEKLIIFCADLLLFCEYHLEDGWTIAAKVEVPYCQAY